MVDAGGSGPGPLRGHVAFRICPCRKARWARPEMNPGRHGKPCCIDHRPQHGDETGDGEARHHGVADVLLAHRAAVEEADPGTVIISTSATEVSIHAVSPELGVHFSRVLASQAGGAGSAAAGAAAAASAPRPAPQPVAARRRRPAEWPRRVPPPAGRA